MRTPCLFRSPLFALLTALPLLAGCQDAKGGTVDATHGGDARGADAPRGDVSASDSGGGLRPWIDTHGHPTGLDNSCLTSTCVNAAVATMESFAVRKSIWMSPPSLSVTANESDIRAAVEMRPDRLFFGAGGTELNCLIQKTPDTGIVTEEQRRAFLAKVESLLAPGGVAAFGEIAALHLSWAANHPFEETRANTPLFQLLADEAAKRGLAIDLHMDAVSEDEDTPSFFAQASPNNPARLSANVPALEALLAYNRNARIVWAHVGRDTTGQMTPDLVRRLVEAHSNLYCQIAPEYRPLKSPTAIVDGSGTIRPAWLQVIEAHPDRFVLGTDTFYKGTAEDQKVLRMVQHFLGQLPADLALRIGCTNPVAVYGLPSGC